jgi:hypothetical protein
MTSCASRGHMSSERSQRWSVELRALAVGALLVPVALLPALGCADFSRGKPLAADTAPPGSGADAGSSTGTSYAADIHVLLIDGCASCHSSAGTAASTPLVFTDSPSDDYTATLDFVDVDAPETSRLVLKMEGRGHAGGAIYPRASSEHALVLRWIDEGAPP